jgi:urease accessory protein
MSKVRLVCLSMFFLVALTSITLAHPGHHHHVATGSGIVAGLTHPLLGIDHLLAMVTVGLLSAQLGGRAIWGIPGAFLGSMVAGGVLGISGWELPAVEYGIAASIVVLGLAVALNQRLSLVIPLIFAAVFGLFHGHAHGIEMPVVANPGLYALGFVAATAGLHFAGILLGKLAINSIRGTMALRLSGATIACAGLWFVLSAG